MENDANDRRREIIDLTHPLTSGMQVYPGDPEVLMTPATSIADDGVVVHSLHLGTHSGTHLDAPSHSTADGETVDRIVLARLVGPLHLVDVTSEPADAGRHINLSEVEGRLQDIAPGAIVVFRTDWSTRFGTPDYLEHPCLDARIATFLLDAGVSVVGIDTLSPDRTGSVGAEAGVGAGDGASFPFHDAFLGAGGVIIENLTSLAAVDVARDPWLSALPLPFAGLDGSPVRAIAVHRS